MQKYKRKLVRLWQTLVCDLVALLLTGCASDRRIGEPASAVQPQEVTVAAVHFAPVLKDLQANRRKIAALTEEAAQKGAEIVVHTEMATSGYSFFSREEISHVAETVPGPTTRELGRIAAKHHLYIVVGLPELEASTGRYFNSAVLIGPSGAVVGTYRKRSELLESSWASPGEGPLVFATKYGKVGLLICADLFYSEFARIEALEGAKLILCPANTGVEAEFLELRAYENGVPLVVANRYGVENQGAKPTNFSEETFSIPLPFAYNFDYGSMSAILVPPGRLIASVTNKVDSVAVAKIDLTPTEPPVERRPELYSVLAQDTLEPYTFRSMKLPPVNMITAAAMPPIGSGPDALKSLEDAVDREQQMQTNGIRLMVFPKETITQLNAAVDLTTLVWKAAERNVDIVFGLREQGSSVMRQWSILITAEGGVYRYEETHRGRGEAVSEGPHFFVIDRPYGRLALLLDSDLLAPETSRVCAKLGVDLAAVSANTDNPLFPEVCSVRAKDGIDLIVANRRSVRGIYYGNYAVSPNKIESNGDAVGACDTRFLRDKKEPRHIDHVEVLLRRNGRQQSPAQ